MTAEEKKLRDKKVLKLFLIFSLGISFILEIAYIIFNKITGNEYMLFNVAIMWTPAITAIVMAIKYYKNVNMLGVSIGRATPILLGLFLPFVYIFLSYLLSWVILGDKTIGFTALATDLGWKAESKDLPVFYILSHVLVGILPSCAGAFGEELGWRGFMYPIMERVHGRKKALLFSGLIFAGWHLPLFIAGLYPCNTVLWYGIIMFIIYEVVLGVILAWLRSVSKSILPPLLVYASTNLFGKFVFQEMGTNDKVPYLAGETGIITIVLMALVALLGLFLWKRHDAKKADAVTLKSSSNKTVNTQN